MRVSRFPEKPSRLKSLFACQTVEAMRCYGSVHCPNGFVYEVVMTDESARTHKGDFNAVEPLHGRPEDMWSMAQAYWEYALKTSVQEWPGIECSEIVMASPLTVVRKIAK